MWVEWQEKNLYFGLFICQESKKEVIQKTNTFIELNDTEIMKRLPSMTSSWSPLHLLTHTQTQLLSNIRHSDKKKNSCNHYTLLLSIWTRSFFLYFASSKRGHLQSSVPTNAHSLVMFTSLLWTEDCLSYSLKFPFPSSYKHSPQSQVDVFICQLFVVVTPQLKYKYRLCFCDKIISGAAFTLNTPLFVILRNKHIHVLKNSVRRLTPLACLHC